MKSGRKVSSTNNINRNDTIITCPFMRALVMIEGRWKVVIVCYLRDHGTLSFSQLESLIPKASKRMLAKALNELTTDRIIDRKQLPTFPKTVEYSLSIHGQNLVPVIEDLKNWGLTVKPEVELVTA